MSPSTDYMLNERWKEYESFRSQGAEYSAFVALAEMENYLTHADEPRSVVSRWQRSLASVTASEEEIARIQKEVFEQIARLERMLSIGSEFVYEELVLALSTRVDLEVLRDFFSRRGWLIEVDSSRADTWLDEIAASSANRDVFRQAQAAVRRNSAISLVCPWLADGLPS